MILCSFKWLDSYLFQFISRLAWNTAEWNAPVIDKDASKCLDLYVIECCEIPEF